MYSFPDLEQVCFSKSSSNCCFLTCIQISQDAGQVTWYSHVFQNVPQFVVIHTVKDFGIANKAEIDVFLELSHFLSDPTDVGNLLSGSSAFSKSRLNIWKFMAHVFVKAGLEKFEHYFARVWDECNCALLWSFFGIAFLWDWGFPGGLEGKSVCLQCRRPGFDPWVRKIPWRWKGQPTPVLLPGKFHGWRSLAGYSPWDHKESDMTERPHTFFETGMKTDLFQSCGHCWVFQIYWHIECSTFTASSFRIWNSSTGIPSPPLSLFVVMLPKAHLTLHSRISGSRWVITPSWLSGSWRPFLYSSVYSCHLFFFYLFIYLFLNFT